MPNGAPVGVDRVVDIATIPPLSSQGAAIRAALFIDGFNLYHAINDLGSPYLKWCNYWRLGEQIIARDESLAMVVTATAFYPDFNKRIRHEAHIKALENVGVKVLKGHYIKEDVSCRSCERSWKKPTEKEGDINVALALIDAAYRDQFDHAYLITADTDQVATLKLFSKRFEPKRVTSVSPPGRPHSQDLLAHAKPLSLKESHIDLSVFPAIVPGTNGKAAVKRPREYEPPIGWVHPDQRPKRTR